MNRWQKIIGLGLLLGVLAQSCKETGTGPDTRVQLAKNQSARLGAGLTVQVDSIQDSRCPENVNCVWAGYAFAGLTLSKSSDSQTIRLYLGSPLPSDQSRVYADSAVVRVSNQTVKVLLKDIVPYNNTNQPNRAKQAIIDVKAL